MERYGVVISNPKRVLVIKGIFADYYEAIHWLRRYITDRVKDCMGLGVGNTHMQVDWHSSNSDLLESADIDFGDGSYNARIVPIIELPRQKYNDLDLDVVTGLNKYIATRLKEDFNGNSHGKVHVLELSGMKFFIGGFQRTELYCQMQVAPCAYQCGYREIVAITCCNSDGKEYIVFLDQLTRAQVEKLAWNVFIE